jgi:hypothetical protein
MEGKKLMAQSKQLSSETGAMRRIEAAFAYTNLLPDKARKRVLSWAADEYLAPANAAALTEAAK